MAAAAASDDFSAMKRAPSKAQQPEGLAGAVKHVVKFFLEKDHYMSMAKILSEQWSNSHSLTAAVRLMEAHGVRLTPEEETRYAMLPEDLMIQAFVNKMPQQDLETFEYFFVQLSLISSSTTRLRKALDEGDSSSIEEILEGAESTGILAYMLKMFVAQAGGDCKQKEEAHDVWLQEARAKMMPLLQSQSTSMVIHRALAEARAKFGYLKQDASSKSKKVLMGMCGKANGALQAGVFVEWAALVRLAKREAVVLKEYEEEIEAAQARLVAYREQQCANIRAVINAGASRDNAALLETCFRVFVEDVLERKHDEEMNANVRELEERMKNFAEDAAATAKKVLSSISAESDGTLMKNCYSAWKKFHDNYLNDKEMEDAVKAAELRLKEFEAKHKEDAKGVLSRMTTASETGLKGEAFQAWSQHVLEEKKSAELADQFGQKAGSLDGFHGKAKGAAMKEMLRMSMCGDEGLCLAIFLFWKRQSKVEGIKRVAREKNAKKKTQLLGVKNLFKNFASELDAGLNEGTPRQLPPARPGPRSNRSRTHGSSGHGSSRAGGQALPGHAEVPRNVEDEGEDPYRNTGHPSGPE